MSEMHEAFVCEMRANGMFNAGAQVMRLDDDTGGFADRDINAMWAGFSLAWGASNRDELLAACERALNYAKNVARAEGVYFDDDDDLPFIESVVKRTKGGGA